ncbi:hypothetical protein SAMN05660748_2408 [Blastococcus aggregatus]|uniref:Uncharacterized protein n=1 Tax=Blastococcus aggregatus TaxID=38502 RepID=A0A285V9F0_9ACTN|nr:hypothetical protein [Blastococcus aggregatus]SOC49676.1 hypothetical protein SAMN05660748_2408 [Blastococcus aggregatus]
MEFMAIVERRPLHRFVCIPVLDAGAALPDREDPQAFATDLVARTLGVPAAEVQVSTQHALLGQTLVPTTTADVEVLHDDGSWRAAQQSGWLKQWHGSWAPLVSYRADGIAWTRAVHTSRMRRPLTGAPAIPTPRRRAAPDPKPTL